MDHTAASEALNSLDADDDGQVPDTSSGGLLHGGLRSGDIIFEKESPMQKFMINPNGGASMAWDCLTVVMVIYDLITIPLQVFNIVYWLLDMMDVVVAVTWTIDILISFFRGMTDGGAVDMRPKAVAYKYIRSWFFLDLTVVSVDWMLMASSDEESEDMDFLQVLRGRVVLRMLRILRLVRIMKFVNRENSPLNSFVLSENHKAIGSVMQLLVAIILINHYVACGWFAVGSVGFGRNWIMQYMETEDKLAQYLTSVHWAVTQFTPAAMDLVPVNTFERAYAVITIFGGLVLFSSFVSNMTSAMNHLNKLTSEQRNRNSSLRQYVADNRVSLALLNCIVSYQKSTKSQERKRLHETDVIIFKTLPEDLLQKLHEEVYAPVISVHPLFQHLAETEESTTSNICHWAMAELSLLVGEELFRCGMRGTKMFFTITGKLAYFLGYDEQVPQKVFKGQWICEPVLWSNWDHRGRLTVSTAGTLKAKKVAVSGTYGP